VLLRLADLTYKTARRVVVTLVGVTVLLIGLVLLVTPGPALVVIPVGLAILGLEWAWARQLLRAVKDKSGAALKRVGLGEFLRDLFGSRSADG